MLWLIAGLLLFLGVHLFSSLRPVRARLIAKLGEGAYKGLYALYAMWSQNRRGARPTQTCRAIAGDIGAVVVGLIAYGLLMKFHPNLFGVAVNLRLVFLVPVVPSRPKRVLHAARGYLRPLR